MKKCITQFVFVLFFVFLLCFDATLSFSNPVYEALISTDFSPRTVSQRDREKDFVLHFDIRNDGALSWSSQGQQPICLGYHLKRFDGTVVQWDYPRAGFASVVEPGMWVNLLFPIDKNIFPSPGRYLLEFDLVHEGVTWFADRGSQTATIPVWVRDDFFIAEDFSSRDERQMLPLREVLSRDRTLEIVDRMARELVGSGFSAGDSYSEVWIRDFNTFIELACQVHPAEAVRETLLRFFYFQGEDGNIPDGLKRLENGATEAGNRSLSLAGWESHKNTVETDQESSLILAVYKYIQATADAGILLESVEGKTVLERLEMAMDFLARYRTESAYGLLWGGTTADWGDVQPEHPWGVHLDGNSHRAIDVYDNALYVQALECLARMVRDKDAQEKWYEKAGEVRLNIRRYLWDEKNKKFIPHLYPDGSPFPVDFDENAIWYHGGTGVAIEAGVLSKDEVATVLGKMRENTAAAGAATIGLTVWPPYPSGFFQNKIMRPGFYQNGGDWSWYGARIVHGLIREGFYADAWKELRPMLDRVLANRGFFEWYTRDNVPQGSGSYRGEAGVLWAALQRLREAVAQGKIDETILVSTFPYDTEVWAASPSVHFGVGGNAGRYMKFGFSEPEDGFTHTDGDFAMLALRLPFTGDAWRLDFDLFPSFLVEGRLDEQVVEVSVNGHPAGSWEIKGEERKTIVVPSEILWNGRAYVVFALKTAAAPRSFEINDDGRNLGIAFREISIQPDAMAALKNSQSKIERAILDEFRNGNHTLSRPLVVQDPYSVAPLTALILFNTEQPAQISLKVEGKDLYSQVEYTFPLVGTRHVIPVLGLYPDYENIITLTAVYRDQTINQKTLRLTTDPLPPDFPVLMLTKAEPGKMAKGFTLAAVSGGYHFIYDHNADIRWIYEKDSAQVFNRLTDGNFIITGNALTGNEGLSTSETPRLQEIDLLGKVCSSFYMPRGIHHDAIQIPSGNYLVTTRNDDYYVEDTIGEVDKKSGKIVNEINLRTVFQTDFYQDERLDEENRRDWAHLNSIWYDEEDRSVIISCRNKSLVTKLSYPEGTILWILASPDQFQVSWQDKILKPKSGYFKYPETQHAAMKLDDLDGDSNTIDIVLFDNNNVALLGRKDEDLFSQGVHYRIDEKKMTIEEIWSYGREYGEALFSEARGDANYYDDAHSYLLSFTGLKKREETNIDSSVVEVTAESPGEVVFHVDFYNAPLYRSERMSLYPDNWTYKLGSEDLKIYGEGWISTDYTISKSNRP